MATRVDLHKDTIARALDKELASLRRSLTGGRPEFRPIIEKDINEITLAKASMSETK